MSHELRTPLNGILGYVQILAWHPTLDVAQKHALTVMQENGEHLLTLITDILDLAKIEARKLELTPTHFALPPFLAAIVDLFHLRAAQNPAVRFHFCVAAPLPAVIYADEQRVRQILFNLLDNAFKFTEKGEITLAVAVAAAPHPGQHRLCFTVTDSGLGISAPQLAKIFLPLRRLATGNRARKGPALAWRLRRSWRWRCRGS